ncbi:hypothetical protein KM043_013636 [Ampulex compressa]|nr:hypothetical protein KM043_013636 [Ampulex compressa]
MERGGEGGGCEPCNEWRSILSLGQARAFTPRCSPGDTEPRVVARVPQEGHCQGSEGGAEGGGGCTGHSLLVSAMYALCPKSQPRPPRPGSSVLTCRSPDTGNPRITAAIPGALYRGLVKLTVISEQAPNVFLDII